MLNPLRGLFGKLSGGEETKGATPPRQVIIGLDFGTSGTKVAFRDWGPQEGGEILHLIDFGVDLRLGFPRFSVPSSLAVEDGEVFFGEEAESKSRFGCQTFRCLKTALLNPDIRKSRASLPEKADLEEGDVPGTLGLEAQAEFQATLFLAYVLHRSWGPIQQAFPDMGQDEFSINLDVPVNHLQDSKEESLFRQVCAHALLMRTQVDQRMGLTEALHLWEQVRRTDDSRRLLQPGSRAEVVAEGQALIQGVGVAREWGQGSNYVAIDLGAGTTDVGVFRLHAFREKGKMGFTRRIPFYSAMTALVGCDSIDQSLLERTGAKPAAFERMRGAVRAAKSELCASDGEESVSLTGGWELSRQDLIEAVRPTAEQSFEHYQTAFGQAYKKDRNQCFWEELKLFVMGGGSLIPDFREKFWAPPRPIVKDVELWEVPGMEGAEVCGASTDGITPEEIPFLVVANGLTFSTAWMPELVTPDDVKECGNIEKEIEDDWDWEDGYSK